MDNELVEEENECRTKIIYETSEVLDLNEDENVGYSKEKIPMNIFV